MKNIKKSYAAPELTVVTIAAERGFSGSVQSSNSNIDDYSAHETYGRDNNTFF
ncbi:MAG: hypothetical protein J6I49_00705 [Bacteroidales bacterium]|nr:hypothetical protein [Bacteroidales bacterium]